MVGWAISCPPRSSSCRHFGWSDICSQLLRTIFPSRHSSRCALYHTLFHPTTTAFDQTSAMPDHLWRSKGGVVQCSGTMQWYPHLDRL